MLIKFKELTLQNFKSHQDLKVKFGDLTKITGDNDKGKTSIGEAITWLLYGTELYGVKMTGKLDPTPTAYESDFTKAELLFEVDDKQILLGREIAGNRNKYIVNDVPSKATEFNQVVDQLFDKDLFLSLFSPKYFFTLHWEKQREIVLRYVTAPANKEVFKELPKPQADKLSALVKKNSLEDLDKIRRDNKNKKDKAYIAAQARTKTSKEQLDEFEHLVPLPSLRVEDDQLKKQIQKIQDVIDQSADTNKRINDLNNQIHNLNYERNRYKDQFQTIKSEEIKACCQTCKQPLQAESIKAVEDDQKVRMNQQKIKFEKAVADRKKLEAELGQLTYVDVSEQYNEIQQLQAKQSEINKEIDKHTRLESVQTQVKEAEKQEKETLESLNESIFILDSIKAFHAKEAELQVKKVQNLFETLSISLFKEQKNGDIKPDFSIKNEKGVDYVSLSNSGTTRAGLELREVLSEQSGVIAPCFIDNAESITKFKEPNGQLILARVVAGVELTIESEVA